MHILTCMKKTKTVWAYLAGKYQLLVEKKYTTIAGTLVFFLLMSLVPMLFWATLLLGKLHVETPNAVTLPGLDEVGALLDYIRREAQNATSGASVFLLITSLYSATNLFYQMRKSGELIYEASYRGNSLKTRLGAVGVLFLLLALIVMAAMIFAIVSVVFSRFLGEGWEVLLRYLLLGALAFFLVFFLNLYICPYKASPKCFVFGSFLTVVAWVMAIIGFSIYLKIGNMGRLYGALTAVIVFLLWLYMLTVCFVAGVIFNSERVVSNPRLRK